MPTRVHVTRFVVNGQLVPEGYVWCTACLRLLTADEWARPCELLAIEVED